MFFKGLLFLTGVIVCLRLASLPPAWFAFGLPLLAWLAWRCRRCHYPCWALGGFLWALFNAQLLLQQQLLPRDEGKSLDAIGVVVSLPETRGTSTRFNFRVEQLQQHGHPVTSNPGKVRLSWYQGSQSVRPGEQWRLKIRLKRPRGYMNPGGFDYESWLFQNRLRATGYVVDDKNNARLRPAGRFNPDSLRFALREKIRAGFPNDPLAALVPALAVGDRSALSDAQWRALTVTGANHLIAISGLHIGLVAGLTYLLLLKLWGTLPIFAYGPLGNIPPIRAAALGAMLAALVYALLAGFSLPTQRALIMLWVYFGMKLYDRSAPAGDVLGIALIAVLILDPLAPMAASFWLSFGAVAVIFYGVSYRVHLGRHKLREAVRVQYIVTLGLAPALALYYQQIPVLSLLANLFAVPWVSFVLIPLVFGGCLLLLFEVELLLELALVALRVLWWVLAYFAGWEFQLLPVARPELPVLAFATIGVMILLLPRGSPGRWLGALWLAPLLFSARPGPGFGEVVMTVLDVGQGLAVVVRTQDHAMLYDTGPGYASGFNTGAAVVTPFLRNSGIRKLDLLVQSHGDNDHIGGLPGVLQEVPVDRIISSVPDMVSHPQVRDCRDGQSWRWDGVQFEVLHPVAGVEMSANDRSCVVQVHAHNSTLLLSGDIEQAAERSLLQRHRTGLKSDVLVVPHHGSKTSSTDDFIRAVDPNIAIFPVGYRNRFGLPNQDVVARYREHGARLLSAAESGAIRIRTSNSGITITEHREKHRRFWHTGLSGF